MRLRPDNGLGEPAIFDSRTSTTSQETLYQKRAEDAEASRYNKEGFHSHQANNQKSLRISRTPKNIKTSFDERVPGIQMTSYIQKCQSQT